MSIHRHCWECCADFLSTKGIWLSDVALGEYHEDCLVECRCGDLWPASLLRRDGCPACSGDATKSTTEGAHQDAGQAHAA